MSNDFRLYISAGKEVSFDTKNNSKYYNYFSESSNSSSTSDMDHFDSDNSSSSSDYS